MFTLEVDSGLTLTLVEKTFAAKYLKIVSQQRAYLSQWLVWPLLAHDEVFFEGFIEKSLHDYAIGKSLVCGMIYDGELVGNVSFNTINQSLKKVEIGYWLSAEHQGKGIVSRSVAKLIDLAFTELQMEKVEIFVATENKASRSVCERLGFELEGVITRAEQLNGRTYDHAAYGLSRGGGVKVMRSTR
ncbi:Ribosomal-protein-serine acetyltransferase [Shewanella piezotolerans WP3]|uniref:Ribosomal-protein-serine acetyltransferase n=1 Tax=Shewanella piezotolerans (strain WP3 / JCM 13877) TaxID=225849 RepID=B8CQB7_SHEPW|nr:GNAT family protein [Shewanella piezotolerans]ACJ30247.1 Ribosomal-protein-serine acetyltransferase [Shewanella piezotolerans WP3]